MSHEKNDQTNNGEDSKMRKNLLLGIIVLITFWPKGLQSAESKGTKVTLDGLVEVALQQNLQIQVAKQEWEAALHKIPQVKAMPDPVLSYAHFGQSIETRLGPQRNKISVSQHIPFFGKLGLMAEVAAQNAYVVEQQYHAIKADVVLKVKHAFFSLFLIDKSVQINQDVKSVYRRLSEIALKKYETGQASQQEALKAQLEISKITERLLSLQKVRKAVVAELNSLLNREIETSVGIAEEFSVPELEIDLEQLMNLARRNRPELRRAQSVIQKNQESLKLVKKENYPDFRVMLDYIDIGAGTTAHPDDGRNSWMASIGVNIPIWQKKHRAAEAEAAIRIKASEDAYNNLTNQTLSQISALYFEITTAREQIELFKYSLLPQAEQALKASEVGYLAGKADFLSLLDSERMILTIKNGYFKILAELGKSFAQLERLVGEDLLKLRSEKSVPRYSDSMTNRDTDFLKDTDSLKKEGLR
jgi:outer membrane protein TolC